MSNYNSIIEQNNTELEGILDTINTLPDAGPSVEYGQFSIMGFMTGFKGGYVLMKFPFVVGMTWLDYVGSQLDTSSGGLICGGSSSFVVYTPNSGVATHISTDGSASGQVTGADYIESVIYAPYVYASCCFSAGTQVLTSLDGNTKSIEDMVIGDFVVSYNVETGDNYLTEVKRVVVNENTTDIAEVYFDNGSSVIMNAYHPLYTENGFHSITGYMGFEELVVGDNVKTVDGWTVITSINRYVSEPIITYNIDVRDIGEEPDDNTNDTFYANGIVAHNPPTC